MYQGTETLTNRTTQLLAEHACFGVYLRRMGTENARECSKSVEHMDNTKHNLSDCTEYRSQRLALKSEIAGELMLHTLEGELTGTENERMAVILFYENVMEGKEKNQNERERLLST